MSRDLLDLQPDFRQIVERILAECDAEGYLMKPFFTLRTPMEQAKLWRQSRGAGEIRAKIRELEDAGADWLAQIIDDAGPQYGRWATNAPPGYSWHQWGLAVDCFHSVDGRAVWDGPAYEVYARIAERHGMTAGIRWTTPDAVHIQAPSRASPAATMDAATINQTMKEMFA